MLAPRRGRTGVLETRSRRYHVAWIPLARSSLPGFRACAIQATPLAPTHARPVRLVLYERIDPLPADGDAINAA